MAKLLFFNVPGHGHVNPTLPVAAELVQRGHEVVYYNTVDFAAPISRTGASFRPYPATDALLTPTAITHLAGNLVDITLLLFAESLRLLPFTLAELTREQPDVVVFDSICLWGMQAAHLQDLPRVATISTMIMEGIKGVIKPRDLPYLLRSALPRLPGLLRLRRQLVRTYGSAIFPHKDVFPCVGQKSIVFTAAEFQPPTPFIDENFVFVGPAIAPATRAADDFPWYALRPGKRIYVSLGTVHQNPAFFQTLLASCARIPAQFIVSAGPIDLAALAGASDNFLIRPTVPQLALLSQVDLFITHGGNNRVHEALYHGVPMLVAPQQFEQATNGRLVARHGAGVVVGDRPPYGRRLKGAALRTALERLLSDDAYARAAAALGESMRATGGFQQAADVIEATAGAR